MNEKDAKLFVLKLYFEYFVYCLDGTVRNTTLRFLVRLKKIFSYTASILFMNTTKNIAQFCRVKLFPLKFEMGILLSQLQSNHNNVSLNQQTC